MFRMLPEVPRGCWWDACFTSGMYLAEKLKTVVKWKVSGVFAFTRCQAADLLRLDLLRRRLCDLDPFPYTVGIARTKIDAANPCRWHVRHGKIAFLRFVMNVNRRGIGSEPNHHARTISAQVPNIAGDRSFCGCRQTIKLPHTFLFW